MTSVIFLSSPLDLFSVSRKSWVHFCWLCGRIFYFNRSLNLIAFNFAPRILNCLDAWWLSFFFFSIIFYWNNKHAKVFNDISVHTWNFFNSFTCKLIIWNDFVSKIFKTISSNTTTGPWFANTIIKNINQC